MKYYGINIDNKYEIFAKINNKQIQQEIFFNGISKLSKAWNFFIPIIHLKKITTFIPWTILKMRNFLFSKNLTF